MLVCVPQLQECLIIESEAGVYERLVGDITDKSIKELKQGDQRSLPGNRNFLYMYILLC